MEFLNPYAFWLLILIPLFFIIKPKKLNINPKIIIKSPFDKKKRFYILLIAYVFLVIALARPIILNSTQKIKISQLNIFILLDASKGMKCKDIYPNRFDAAVNKLKEFFKMLNYQNVAVVLVDKNPYILSPLTTDYSSIIYLLEHINKKEIFLGDSDFLKAYNSIKELSKNNSIFLTISYKAPKLPNSINYVVAKKPCIIDSKIYAPSAEGIHFSYSNSDLKEILSIIKQYGNAKEVVVKNKKELFYYPLFIAILLIFIASFSIRVKK